jgi:hypothetical protein
MNCLIKAAEVTILISSLCLRFCSLFVYEFKPRREMSMHVRMYVCTERHGPLGAILLCIQQTGIQIHIILTEEFCCFS